MAGLENVEIFSNVINNICDEYIGKLEWYRMISDHYSLQIIANERAAVCCWQSSQLSDHFTELNLESIEGWPGIWDERENV